MTNKTFEISDKYRRHFGYFLEENYESFQVKEYGECHSIYDMNNVALIPKHNNLKHPPGIVSITFIGTEENIENVINNLEKTLKMQLKDLSVTK